METKTIRLDEDLAGTLSGEEADGSREAPAESREAARRATRDLYDEEP